MTAGLVAASVAAVLVGLTLVVRGMVPMPVDDVSPAMSTGSSTGLWTRCTTWFRALSARQRVMWMVAGAAGLVAFAVTGWLVMLVAVPVAVLGLPALLSAPVNRDLQLLEALDRWVRLLTSSLPTGKSIADAMRATRRQTPALLTEPVTVAVTRLDARWSPADALRAMADDLASPDADAVLAALMLAAERGGVGATATLRALAESIQDRLRALREIEAERAKPRIVVRQVTVITTTVLGLGLVFGGSFFGPYGSPVGQVVLALLLTLYVLSLLVLRRKTIPRTRERILKGRTEVADA